MLRRLGTLTSILIFCSAALAQKSPVPTADEMLARIERDGGHKVLWALWEDQELFDALLEPVERADPKWLEVWQKLKPFSDAGASESINIAVARALPVAPERILNLIGHGFSIDFICTSPFIEESPEEVEAYERKTLEALSKVKDPKLKPIAEQCAKSVKLQPVQ